jgi:hypothetical protein
MDPASKLAAVFELAERLAIQVRITGLGGDGGGLCGLPDRRILFVDSDADIASQADRSLSALAQMPDLDNVFIVPELREALRAARADDDLP